MSCRGVVAVGTQFGLARSPHAKSQERRNVSKVIESVGVVGCGLMGSGIAEVAARAGLDVTVTESSPSAAEAGIARVAPGEAGR